MVIYLLLKAVIFILSAIAEVFGTLIPDYPDAISSIMSSLSSMLKGGIAFVSYFFDLKVVIAFIGLVLSWHGFKVVKNAIMAVIGHFIGN